MYPSCAIVEKDSSMGRILHLIILLGFWSAGMATHAASRPDTCRMVKIVPERLPDLHIARSANTTLNVNGELTVFGGHTQGFIPTPTAEYYRDGEWHLMQMVYPHDFGLTVKLKSGKVLLAGGAEKPLGIGQTFPVEYYDPATHTFKGFGCLDQKRVFANGLELDSGRVVISGNWYADDGIELFDGHKFFHSVKGVTSHRAGPIIFRISADDAIIFGGASNRGATLSDTIVDRLRGEPVAIPLLKTWHPLNYYSIIQSDNSFIGDEQKGIYAYLLAVQNADGQVAIAKAQGLDFSLLPTACPVPTRGHGNLPIAYCSPVIIDKKAQRGYLFGSDKDFKHYILAIDYGKQPATLMLYYTDPMPRYSCENPVLTSDGNLVLAGGSTEGDNFEPTHKVFLFRVGGQTADATGNGRRWLWALVPILLIIAGMIAGYLLHHRRRRRQALEETAMLPTASPLMESIRSLMESQQLFLREELRVKDVAEAIGTSTRNISDCIKLHEDCTFNAFVNRYRILYAQQLLREHPDKKMSTVGFHSGFANEETFFRTFKAFTGMTPKEWQAKND